MKIDRLLGILTVLLQKDRVTAPELAERFEVSRRTIGRDIDTLCMAGIPVITRQGSGGGISVAEGFKLDKTVLTADELSVTIDLASHYKGQLTDKIECLKRAVLARRIIEFDYFYEKGESHRRIEPYFVIFQWKAWYVFGFCLERSDFRLFKLQRLWDLHLCDEKFVPREIPPEKRDFTAWVTADKENKLVALFDPSEKYQLIETYGLDCYEETTEGLLFEIEFTNRDYILTWLLGFGSNVKVLEPEAVVEDIKRAAENILSMYI